MPLDQQIDAASKEFLAAIKEAEARSKQLAKQGAELSKAGNGFSSEIKRVATALSTAQSNLEAWEKGTEAWIDFLKEQVNAFAGYKKKSIAVEKYFSNLQDDKAERDKARKKQGGKPSKEDEIADAAFQRAKTAYDNDPGRETEAMLKDVGAMTTRMEKDHEVLAQSMKEALADYEKLNDVMSYFTRSLEMKRWDQLAKINAVGPEFDDYFKRFR